MIDLNHFFQQYNENLMHHRAAVNELMREMPKELLRDDAEWVVIFESADTEWGYNKIVNDKNT